MKCYILISVESKKNIDHLSTVGFAHRVLKANAVPQINLFWKTNQIKCVEMPLGFVKKDILYKERRMGYFMRKGLTAYADSEGSDQPAHPRRLIRAFALRFNTKSLYTL